MRRTINIFVFEDLDDRLVFGNDHPNFGAVVLRLVESIRYFASVSRGRREDARGRIRCQRLSAGTDGQSFGMTETGVAGVSDEQLAELTAGGWFDDPVTSAPGWQRWVTFNEENNRGGLSGNGVCDGCGRLVSDGTRI